MPTKEEILSVLLPHGATPSQLDAILCQDGPILVSASAGSGKTFVLATRAVYMLANPENPLDPRRVLIVTFTRAAAKEMRSRITSLFDRLISEFPTDRFLTRQRSLLMQAKITTIDSYCASLLREEFQKSGVSPNFRMASEQELSLLYDEVLEELLEEEAFKEGDSFQEFCDYFSLKGDEELKSILLRIYEDSRARPFPIKYIKELTIPYQKKERFSYTLWAKPLLNIVKEETKRFKRLVDMAIAEAKADFELFEKWKGFLEEYKIIIDSFSDSLDDDWEDILKLSNNIAFPSAPRRLKSDVYSVELADKIKKRYLTPIRDGFGEIKEKYLWKEEEALLLLEEQRLIVKKLAELTEKFYFKVMEKTEQKNILSFSDLVLKTIELLFDENTEKKTPLGEEISDSFDAVFVDEFQDVNDTQDLLFSLLSAENEKNLFLVGDVKQSIYRFRKANPDIFLRRRRLCEKAESNGKLFSLSENFRSRPEVTGTVNSLFSKIMTESFGGLSYLDSEMLYSSGTFCETDNADSELVFLSGGEIEEAEYIAGRIDKALKEGFLVSDGTQKRPCRPGDFAILLRSGKEHASVFLEALRRKGVNGRTEGTSGYFQAREVVLILSLLQIIDNPTLDIPMVTVLLSPLFSFTPDEMVRLRRLSHEGSFYNCLCLSKENKAKDFIKKLHSLRQDAAVLSVSKLIQKIYDETLFYSLFGADESSDRKLANLRLLLSYAGEYERSKSGSLTGFLRFLESAKEAGKDFESANPTHTDGEAVSIITIHKSKGLEFPVVFLARCSAPMRFRELQGTAVFSNRYGIALKHAYPKKLTQFPTIPYFVSQFYEKREGLQEELRILYVAMTRAKEKLIMTVSGDKKTQDDLEIFQAICNSLDASQAKCYADWFEIGFNSIEKDSKALDNIEKASEVFAYPKTIFQKVEEKTESEEKTLMAQPDEEKFIKLKEDLLFEYPNQALCKIPAKLAATELTRIKEKRNVNLNIPNFSDKLTPSQKGTANHAFLQFADFSAAEKDLENEIVRMTVKDYITQKEADVLDRDGLCAFFKSSIYARIKKADEVFREFSFFYELPVSELEEGVDSTETVLIQGIADCVINECDLLTIIDYKTDRASVCELKERYRSQLELYQRAISKALGKPVEELIIYSLFLREIIEL